MDPMSAPDSGKTGQAATILVVDDNKRSREAFTTLLGAEGYDAIEAGDGASALEKARTAVPDLVLLDIVMPDMDGYEVARRLKRAPATRSVPIIMITGLSDRESRLRGLEAGAEEFVSKPVDLNELRMRIRNLLKLKEYGDFLEAHNRILEAQVRDRTARLIQSHRETILVLTAAAEHKDEDTRTHLDRVSFYTSLVARQLGLGDEFANRMFYASPMHDIGKIGIPDHILLKPGELDEHERAIMQGHAELGAKILGEGVTPYVELGAEIALTHHEHWDGSGYPRGLKGENIPLAGRITVICDQYDALRSKRPYKPALSHERAVEILTRGDSATSPDHFDPAILQTFLRSADKFAGIYAAHSAIGAVIE